MRVLQLLKEKQYSELDLAESLGAVIGTDKSQSLTKIG